MDVLDKYKETWKNQSNDIRLSKIDIYKLMHKKSTSIVKWIFIIGILEFVFIAILSFILKLNSNQEKDFEEIQNYITFSEIISYAIIVYFLVKFYQNYRSISSADDTKTLMNKILKTRKTVKNYIITSISISFISVLFIMIYFMYTKDFEHTSIGFYVIVCIAISVIILIAFLLYWVYYQLLYGILLRKLNRNYKELAKLDDIN